MKILHLTLKRKWFNLIRSGEKTIEYREIKPYWDVRLKKAPWDAVLFTNGYGPRAPSMLVEYVDLKFGTFEGVKHYAIHLGDVVLIRPYEIMMRFCNGS